MLPVDIQQCDLLKKKRSDYAKCFLQGQVSFKLYLTGYIAKAQRPAEDISWFFMSKGLGGHLMFQAFSYHQEPFSLNLDLTLDGFFLCPALRAIKRRYFNLVVRREMEDIYPHNLPFSLLARVFSNVSEICLFVS